MWALRILERRFQPSASLTRAGHLATGAGVVLLILVALVRFGSPITIAGDMYDRFNAPPPGGFKGTAAHAGRDLNLRLFSLSGNARADLWRIAWHDYQHHEVLGAGAGTYESYYLQHRTNGLKVKNAHNLYLETLTDLGPIGLLLLVAGLAAPLVAGVRAREEALVPVAFGGFAAYLLHAGADWDWQMTAVTLTALTCAVGMLSSTPSPRWSVSLTGRGVRAGILAAIALMAVLALVGLRGNVAAAASQRAASTHHWVAAESQARTAVSWEPWSADARRRARPRAARRGPHGRGQGGIPGRDRARLAQLAGVARPRPGQQRRGAADGARPRQAARPARAAGARAALTCTNSRAACKETAAAAVVLVARQCVEMRRRHRSEVLEAGSWANRSGAGAQK